MTQTSAALRRIILTIVTAFVASTAIVVGSVAPAQAADNPGDLELIAKNVTPSTSVTPARPGDELTYTLSYRCASITQGDTCAGGVITDVYPTFTDIFGQTVPLQFVSASASSPGDYLIDTSDPTRTTWTATSDLVAGDSGSLSLVLLVPPGVVPYDPAGPQTVTNQASVQDGDLADAITVTDPNGGCGAVEDPDGVYGGNPLDPTPDACNSFVNAISVVSALTKSGPTEVVLNAAGTNTVPYTVTVCAQDERSLWLYYTITDTLAPGTSVVDANGGTVDVASDSFDTVSGVDADNNEVDITGHGYSTGDTVVYGNGGGTDVIGLVDGDTYFVRAVTANALAFYTTSDDAVNDTNRVVLTDGSGESHQITSTAPTITWEIDLGSGSPVVGPDGCFQLSYGVSFVNAGVDGDPSNVIDATKTNDVTVEGRNVEQGVGQQTLADDWTLTLIGPRTFFASTKTSGDQFYVDAAGDTVTYTLGAENTSDAEAGKFSSATLTDGPFPAYFTLTSIGTGTSTGASPDAVTITVETSVDGIAWGTPPGDLSAVRYVRWVFTSSNQPSIGAGWSATGQTLTGAVAQTDPPLVLPATGVNCAVLTGERNGTETFNEACATTILEVAQPHPSIGKDGPPQIEPGETVAYTLSLANDADATGSLVNPQIVDCVPDSASLTVNPPTSPQGSWTLETPPTPLACDSTYRGATVSNSGTLMVWQYTGSIAIGGSADSDITYTVTADDFDAPENGDTPILPGLYINSAQVQQEDGAAINHCVQASCTASHTIRVPVIAELESEKFVRGSADDGFNIAGTTRPGGLVDWQMTVRNVGNVEVTDVSLIDIFPHVGDTGVSRTDQQRGSEYEVFLVAPVEVPSPWTVEYSLSDNPCRADVLGPVSGCDPADWTDIPDLGALNLYKSIRLRLAVDNRVGIGQEVSFTWTMATPVFDPSYDDDGGVDADPYGALDTCSIPDHTPEYPLGPGYSNLGNPESDEPTCPIATNSFAYGVAVPNDQLNGEPNPGRLGSEPAAVDLHVAAAPVLNSIGNYVWEDVNFDGLQGDPADEPGIEGVRVELLYEADPTGAPDVFTPYPGLSGNVTFTDVNGNYQFDGLPEGNYVVRFYMPDDLGFVSPSNVTGDPAGDDEGTPGNTDDDSDIQRIPSGNDEIGNYYDTQPVNLGPLATEADPTWDAGIWFPDPMVLIDKVTKGAEPLWPDEAAGDDINLTGGDPLTWVYTITNTGNTRLENVVITDDNGTPGTLDDFVVTDCVITADGDNAFAVPSSAEEPIALNRNAEMRCIATGVAGVSSYSNEATVSGDPRTDDSFGQLPPVTHMDDSGYVPVLFALGDIVWYERNGQAGYQEGEDDPVEGATVRLFAENGTLLESTTTSATGTFFFTDLVSGNYYVRIPASNFGGGGVLEGFSETTIGFEVDPNGNANDVEGQSGDHNSYEDGGGLRTNMIELSATLVETAPGVFELQGEEPEGEGVHGVTTGVPDDFDNLTLDLAVVGPPAIEIQKEVCYPGAVCDPGAAIGADGWGEQGSYFAGTTVVWRITVTNVGEQILNGVVVNDDAVPACNGVAPFDSGPISMALGQSVSFICSAPLDDSIDPNIAEVGGQGAVTGDSVSDDDPASAFVFTSGLGDRVWFDINQDGNQDGGEPGINGVTVRLTPVPGTEDPAWFGPDGVPGGGDDIEYLEVVTSGDGDYIFENLPPGEYDVTIADLDPAFFPTFDFDGGEDRVARVELAPDEFNPDVDFGESVNYAVGNIVWIDVDGVVGYLPGTDLPVPDGTRVELWNADNTWTGLSTITVDGAYLFDELAAGEYYAVVPADQPGLIGMVEAPGATADPDDNEDDPTDHNAVAGTLGAVQTGIITLGDVLPLSNTPGDQINGTEPLNEIEWGGLFASVPDAYANLTLDLALALPADIQIIKEVCPFGTTCTDDGDGNGNGWVDSDTFPFTATVTWRITVINTGSQDLTNVEVTDTNVAACANAAIPNLLITDDPGTVGDLDDRFSYTCETANILVAIDPNTAVVNAEGVVNGDPATDSDTASALLPAPDPGIQVVKFVNGDDADTAPGVIVLPSSELVFTFVVSNTGNEPLVNVTVTDDNGTPGDNSDDFIAVPVEGTTSGFNVGDVDLDGVLDQAILGVQSFEVWEFEAPAGTYPAPVGQYTNLAVVQGFTEADGLELNDDDPANAFGALTDVQIVKRVQTTFDANTIATGPGVAAGGVVRWTYTVTIPAATGNVPLEDVVVTDDLGTPDTGDDLSTTDNTIVFVGGDADNDGLLDTDETWVYEAFGIAVEGQYGTAPDYGNIGDVTGGPVDENGDPLPVDLDDPVDDDLAHYYGALPDIDVEKYVNGDDADTALDGPFITAGSPVDFTFRVTNTGNVDLTNIELNDDEFGVIPCPLTELAVGESMDCIFSTTAVLGSHDNLAEVTGRGPNTRDEAGLEVPGTEVADEDPANYFGADPSIQILKDVQTNYPADNQGTAPLVALGTDTVKWTFTVTNTGNVDLTAVVVNDPRFGPDPLDCALDALAPGQSMMCDPVFEDGIAGPQTNEAFVTGTPPAVLPPTVVPAVYVDPPEPVQGPDVTDDDPANYFGAEPLIDVEKYVQNPDPTLTPNPAGEAFDADNVFDPADPYPENIEGAVPIADEGLVYYTYVVTNVGNVPLTQVKVVDDRVSPDSQISCDLSPVGTNVIPLGLAPGQSTLCTYAVLEADIDLHGDGFTNTATADGRGPSTIGTEGESVLGVVVTDEDDANFFVADPSVDIEKYVQTTEDADAATGPLVSVNPSVGGADPEDNVVRFRYVVTNTGNVDLTDVTVTDDIIPSGIDCTYDGEYGADTGDNVIARVAPDETYTCWIDQIASAGQYTNTGTVVGTPLPTFDADGNEVPMEDVTDEDDAHYFGADPSIEIVKKTQTFDHTTPNGVLITTGNAVKWTYEVENTGNVPLTDVTVSDDIIDEADIVCSYLTDTDDNVIAGPLPPGGTFSCEATGVAEESTWPTDGYVNVADVVATPPVTLGADGYGPLFDLVEDDIRVQPNVVDDEPDYYYGVEIDIDLTKYVQTDIDANDGGHVPLIAAGDASTPIAPGDDDILWRFRVENTGNYPLVDVIVEDPDLDNVDCGGDVGTENLIGGLAVDEVVFCTATDAAEPGAQRNEATATGTGPTTYDVDGLPVDPLTTSDSDEANYFGSDPSVAIKKYVQTNIDADDAPGPLITPGRTARFVYEVENTGNVPLTDVTVTDSDIASGIVCSFDADTDDNVISGPLAPGETFSCFVDDIATAGQYENTGTVAGQPPATYGTDGYGDDDAIDGGDDDLITALPVTDSDDAHYYGPTPDIRLIKYTQTLFDADLPLGPLVEDGNAVLWTYVVTNIGDVPLSDVTVVDDKIADDATIDCGEGTGNVIDDLAIDEAVTCSVLGTATPGQYMNTGSATGQPPDTYEPLGYGRDGEPGGDPDDDDLFTPPLVDDDNPSHYFGILIDIDIEKSVQTFDADAPTGPLVATGGAVRWEYVVTNTGNWGLTDVKVTDDKIGAITCPETTLGIGQSMSCSADGVATSGQYTNLGSVVGTGPTTIDTLGQTVAAKTTDDTDPANYFGASPAIDIEKLVNGEDADTEALITSPNQALTFTYRVENTGNVVLNDVTVIDDKGVVVDCGQGTGNVINTLAPGATVDCTGSGNAPALGSYTNVGSVEGTPPDTIGVDGESIPSQAVFDEDPANVFTAVPDIDIIKYVVVDDVDIDANTAPGPALNRDSLVLWKMVITNTGNVVLSNVTVSDPILSGIGFGLECDGGSTSVATLNPGSSFTCTGLAVVKDLGLFTNVASVVGTPDFGLPDVSDTDPANYTSVRRGGSGDPLPKTGSNSTGPFTMIATTILALGVALALLGRRRWST